MWNKDGRGEWIKKYVKYFFLMSLMTSNIVKPKGARVPELLP
jgi:hypothetical protein